jgi:hypothetical protein
MFLRRFIEVAEPIGVTVAAAERERVQALYRN